MAAVKQKVLIVDDDYNIADLISLYLKIECYDTMIVGDGEAALEAVSSYQPDLILLDLMLPGMDGYQVCRQVRSAQDTPIIMLSAKGEIFDKVLGLEMGADDYMEKPFDSKELMARVNAVLSRRTGAEKKEDTVLRFDGLEINIPARSVTIDGEKVELTPKEYDLLFYLVENKNIALSRDKLLSDIWGYDFFGDDRTIDTHIKNLRNNLGKYRDYIVTLRGVGYKFEA